MNGDYDDLVAQLGSKLAASILDQEAELMDRALRIDGDIAVLVREVGRRAAEEVLVQTANAAADEAQARGMKVEHRKGAPFLPSSDS